MTATPNSLRALHESLKAGQDKTNQQITKGNGYSLSPDLILEEEGFNSRGAFLDKDEYFNSEKVKAHIRKLADAYKRGDYIPPLTVKVKNGHTYIRDGHHRIRAIRLAIEEGTPIKLVSVVELQGDESAQALLVVTSNDSAPLTVLERAVIFGRLASYGWSAAEIAERVGNSANYIKSCLKMLEMPIEIKRQIQREEVSATHALELYTQHGEAAVEMIRAEYEKLTANQADTTKKVKVTKKATSTGPRITRKVVTAMTEGIFSLSSRLDTVTPLPDGMYTLQISKEELDMLTKFKEMAAASATEKEAEKKAA